MFSTLRTRPGTPGANFRRLGLILVLTVLALLAAVNGSASADFTFCSQGSGAGQCERPEGIAVDRSNGHVYVGGGVNKTTGKDICPEVSGNVCGAGEAGRNPGEFNTGIRPGVGPAGELYVADAGDQPTEPSRVQCFEPAGTFIAQSMLAGTRYSTSLAVDSVGDFYLSFGEPLSVRKYDPSGSLLETLPALGQAIGTDPAGNLFAAERDSGSFVITKYDPSGAILRRFGYGLIDEVDGLRAIAPIHSATGEVYGTELFKHRIRSLSFPPPGPITCCIEATAGNTKATLKGGVNPEGKATTYHLEYIDGESFKSGGFSNPAVKSSAETALGSDFSLHTEEVQIGCASPEDPRNRAASNRTRKSHNPDPGRALGRAGLPPLLRTPAA